MEIRKQILTRYITPLREGGSLPGLAEADDGFKYVVKFRGAGHGNKALIAEFIGGMVAKCLKFKVPELVLLQLDSLFGITEPDEEVQELLRKSEGLNVGLHFLNGAATFDPKVNDLDAMFASKLVWLDAFLTNVDRTRLNPNMMMWHNDIWLIDNGASLYFHHSWKDPEIAAKDPFVFIKNHVALPYASKIQEADKLMKQAITPRTLSKIVDMIPAEFLSEENEDISPEQRREAYRIFLLNRLKDTSPFVTEAIRQRSLIGRQ